MAKKIVIRKYGVRLLGDDKIIVKSLREQNRLWNSLVEIDRATNAEYREIIAASDDELARLTREHATAEERLDEIRLQRNRARARVRSKQIDGAENYAASMKEVSAQLKTLRAAMRECRGRAKEAAKPKVADLNERHKLAVKNAVAEAKMWWCHSELIYKKYEIARARALSTNATLRFSRFEGGGSIGVRFSGGMLLSAPPKTTLLQLREATDAELGHLKRERKGKRIVAMEMRTGNPQEDGSVPMSTFLVTVHEGAELLPNVPLKTVKVLREMRAGKPTWFAVFMFVEEDADEIDDPSALPVNAVGIDFGWRMVRDSEWGEHWGLRVATLINGEGKAEHITLPPDFIKRLERASEQQAALDTSANDFWLRVAPLLTDDALSSLEDDDWLKVVIGKAKRAKRPYPALMKLLAEAHERNPVLGSEVQAYMSTWARQAQRAMEACFGARRRALDHRKHVYRNVAARLVHKYGLLAIKDINFADLALLERAGAENELSAKSRSNRVIAAPSELREAIEVAAKRERRELIKVPAVNTTVTCSVCGHVHGGPILDVLFVCDECGTLHDQDENSARNCLKTAFATAS